MKIELEGAEQQVPKMEPVPFAEAIAWAESRGVVLPHVYYGELQGLARAAAFSIAGVAQLDQLQMVRDSLAEWTRDGGTMAEWMRKVESKEINLELPRHRLENIYRTNLQNHFGRGRCEQQARNVNTRPWFLYDAVNDSRTRPSHAAMDGVVARYDDPLWRSWTPPVGYQCRCRRIALSERQAQRYIEADRNRLQKFPEIAEARATAKPDPGWDYSICGDHPPAQEGQPSPMQIDAQAGKLPAAMRGIEQSIKRKAARPETPSWMSSALLDLIRASLAILAPAMLSAKQAD